MNKITSTIKYSAVLHVTGWLLLLECVMLLIPIAVCLVYGEADWNVFAIASGSCLAPGLALVLPYRHRSFSVTPRVISAHWPVLGAVFRIRHASAYFVSYHSAGCC